MEKTIKEWLSELPDGIKELALANCEASNWNAANIKKSELETAIWAGFDWSISKEGNRFWEQAYDAARGTKPYPILPQKVQPKTEARDLIEEMYEGLKWYWETYPAAYNQADVEMKEKIDAFLSKEA